MTYGYSARTDLGFEEITAKLKDELSKEGFGILTEINVAETMKKKLGVDLGGEYLILGACNPALAHRAIQAEKEIGLLLPCNVIVYTEGDETVVSAILPKAAMSMVENDALAPVAAEAEVKLKAVVDRL